MSTQRKNTTNASTSLNAIFTIILYKMLHKVLTFYTQSYQNNEQHFSINIATFFSVETPSKVKNYQ